MIDDSSHQAWLEMCAAQGIEPTRAEEMWEDVLATRASLLPQVYKICDTFIMRDMIKTAVTRGYNRQAHELGSPRQLDPDGTHICTFSMLHEHRAGEPCELHVRTQWYVKLKNRDEPFTISLDIPTDVYMALQEG